LHAETGNESALKDTYHLASQVVTTLTAGAAAVIVLFPVELLFAWTGNRSLAIDVAPILSWLTLGTFLHGLMFVPYSLQLSYGWTSLAVGINIISVAILVPSIILVTPGFGAIGAAWIWLILNCGYFLVSIPIMHRRLLLDQGLPWYRDDVLLPAAAAVLIAAASRLVFPSGLGGRIEDALLIVATATVATMASALVAPRVRLVAISLLGMPRNRAS